MRAPEPIRGARVVAAAEVLDALPPVPDSHVALRMAHDELFVLGPGRFMAIVPEPGIVEAESGIVGWWLSRDELAEVLHHVEWSVPATRPVLLQGLVAGVPAKLWLAEDRSLLICPAAYAHELTERLG
ncbi:MAG: hypothetical protein ACRDFR_01985 [Candidatus Limnocylindria bacterium]